MLPHIGLPNQPRGPKYRRVPDAAHRVRPVDKPNVTCNTWVMSVKDRVREYRQRMRDQGYRPVQVWVPDVRSERFAAEAHRQAACVAAADADTDDQQFLEAVSAPWEG